MHCEDCGNKLILKFCENEGLVPYCETCEKFVFPPFKTAVSMAVVDRKQEKFLIAKHTNGQYLLLAGYVKKGESAEKTIAREIREETGLSAVKYRYMSSRYHEPRNVLMLGFVVMVSEGEIRLNTDEIEEAGWYSYEEALEKISHDSTAEFFLKSAAAELKRSKL